jgi:hypothetical protein
LNKEGLDFRCRVEEALKRPFPMHGFFLLSWMDGSAAGLPDGIFSDQKFPILVYFCRPWNEKFVNIL